MVVPNLARSLYPACPVYPVYPELRRKLRREPRREPRSERTRRALRALCVSAFSSLDVCPFNFELLALFTLFTLSPEARNVGSVVEGSTARPEQRRRVNRTSLRPFPNSHRITSFAHPHPITPIESYSCKKQGGGVPLTQTHARRDSCLCATRRNPRNSNPFMVLLHNSRTPPGGGTSATLLCASRRTAFTPARPGHQRLPPSRSGSYLFRSSTARPEQRRRVNRCTQLHSQEATQRPLAKNAKIDSYLGGDSVSTEAVAARRHAGTHLPATWWKLEMPTTTWHLLLN